MIQEKKTLNRSQEDAFVQCNLINVEYSANKVGDRLMETP